MTAQDILAMAGYPDSDEGREAFYGEFPNLNAFMAKYGGMMAMGGSTNEVAFPQQPVENKFYSEGFRPSVPFGFYQDGGLTNEVAFPQQPVADKFYNSGWRPSTPFGFYEEGGLTNEIAFPQQPASDWVYARNPYIPSYNVGGGLPGGANNMPCFQCGGYMQDGGSSDSGSQYGGFVGMDAPLTMKKGGVKKSLSKKNKGGKVDGYTQDQITSGITNTFVSKVQENLYPFLQQQADAMLNDNMQNEVDTTFAQYGVSTGYSNPYFGKDNNFVQPYNLQNKANQQLIDQQLKGYSNQAEQASDDFQNAVPDMLYNIMGKNEEYIPKADVGLSAWGQNALKRIPINPSTGQPINTNTSSNTESTNSFNQDVFEKYLNQYLNEKFKNSSNYQQGYSYGNPNYNYAKVKFSDDKTKKQLGQLLSKMDVSKTRLTGITPHPRSTLARMFGMKTPRKYTYEFNSSFNPRTVQNTIDNIERVPAIPTPASLTPITNQPSIVSVNGTNMTLFPGTYMGSTGFKTSNGNINVNENAQYKTYAFGGLPMAVNGISVDPWAMSSNPVYETSQEPSFTTLESVYGQQPQTTIDPNLVETDPISGLSPDQKNIDYGVDVKKKRRIDTGKLARGIEAGVDLFTNVFNQDDVQALQERKLRNTSAGNVFATVPANEVSMGDYDPNTGEFRPNKKTVVQEPGVLSTGMYGGSYEFGGNFGDYEEGEIAYLDDDEIQNILANGGSVEYLD